MSLRRFLCLGGYGSELTKGKIYVENYNGNIIDNTGYERTCLNHRGLSKYFKEVKEVEFRIEG